MSRRHFRLTAGSLGAARVRAALVALGACLLLGLTPADEARAQGAPHPATDLGGPPSLPPGDGTIRGVVVDADHPEAMESLTVALYALQPDGTPGMGSTSTAADGSFAFEGVAGDPGIVYLVGVRYEGVPWGERTGFVAGQREIDLLIPVERPSSDVSEVRVRESTFRIESLGTRIAVFETHSIANALGAPIYVAGDAREGARPPFSARLPSDAMDFETGVFNAGEGFEQRGDELVYWGPIYAGEQELRYAYQVEVAEGDGRMSLELGFPLGSESVRVLTAEGGPRVESRSGELRDAEPIEIEGTRLAVLAGGARAPGASLLLDVHVPETVHSLENVSLGRSELSVELDDTVLEVTQTVRLSVASGAHVAGSAKDPLLRFELPLRATLVGLAATADRLGALASGSGIDVIGPLSPGDHDLAFRYRLPADDGAATLDLRFPLSVPTLVLRAADTGLVIGSDRLHRLRPQNMGTRTWLMREAFDVKPEEQLAIHFEALRPAGRSRVARTVFALAASAFILLGVVGPLRGTRARQEIAEDDFSRPAHERELVYATIRDLEHDFETGKVSGEDYERTRAELRARAIDLLRDEYAAAPTTGARAAGPLAPGGELATPREHPVASGGPEVVATTAFCAACGGSIQAAWRFCSHCGGALEPAEKTG